jgi:putative copper export protein
MTPLLTKIPLRNLISFVMIVCILGLYHAYAAEYVFSIASGAIIDVVVHIALGLILVLVLIGDSVVRLAWMLPTPILSLYATWLLEGAHNDPAYPGLHWVFIFGFASLFWFGGLLGLALSSRFWRKEERNKGTPT